LIIILSVSALIYRGFLEFGIAGDCKPGDRDGQCGLSTFGGFVAGVATGGAFLIIGTIATLLQWYRTKRAAGK
jgi:hypothetical protein